MLGAAAELTAKNLLVRRLGDIAEPYQTGRAGSLLQTGEELTAAGLAGAVLTGRSRMLAALSGAALVTASALTRFGIFEAGRASARDPKYTAGPQRDRLRERAEADAGAVSPFCRLGSRQFCTLTGLPSVGATLCPIYPHQIWYKSRRAPSATWRIVASGWTVCP